MKKYVILSYRQPDVTDEMLKMSPEETENSMQLWFAWKDRYEENVVDMGAPFEGTYELQADGKTRDIKNQATGYMIIQAESLDELGLILQDSPLFPYTKGFRIKILEAQQW